MGNAERSGGPVAGPAGAFGASAATDTATARPNATRLGLWLMAGVLAIRQVAVVLGAPRGSRLTDLETWDGPDGVLHVNGSLYDSTRFTRVTRFTGTPSAASSSNR